MAQTGQEILQEDTPMEGHVRVSRGFKKDAAGDVAKSRGGGSGDGREPLSENRSGVNASRGYKKDAASGASSPESQNAGSSATLPDAVSYRGYVNKQSGAVGSIKKTENGPGRRPRIKP